MPPSNLVAIRHVGTGVFEVTDKESHSSVWRYAAREACTRLALATRSGFALGSILAESKMRRIIHKNHQIAVHPKWTRETQSWACDATVYVTEAGHAKTIPFFDPVRRYKIKASAVTAILNAVRSWIDHGKPEQFPKQ